MSSKSSNSSKVVVQTESPQSTKTATHRWARWTTLVLGAALLIFGISQLLQGDSNNASNAHPTLKNGGYTYTVLFDKTAKPTIVAGTKSLSGTWPGTSQKLTFTAAPVSKDTDLSACGVVVAGWQPDFTFTALGSTYHTCSLHGTSYAGVVKSGSRLHLLQATFAKASKDETNQNIAKSVFSSVRIQKS